MDEFLKSALLSLDNDLASWVSDRKIGVQLAMELQVLRLMRGRPFQISLQPPQTAGWTDGKNMYPSEPGTFTTGNGSLPPEGTK